MKRVVSLFFLFVPAKTTTIHRNCKSKSSLFGKESSAIWKILGLQFLNGVLLTPTVDIL